MRRVPGYKKKANWLLRTSITVSILVHLVLLVYIAKICESKTFDYIEMTLREIVKPITRPIRRQPRRIHVSAPEWRPVHEEILPKLPVPILKKISFDDIKSIAEIHPPGNPLLPSMEKMCAPQIQVWNPVRPTKKSSVSGLTATSNHRHGQDNTCENPISYFQKIKSKIELFKKYPAQARETQAQGSVTVRFVVTAEGQIASVKVMRTSGFPILDRAAVKAVRDAAPLPPPPRRLFRGNVPLQITISFKLA